MRSARGSRLVEFLRLGAREMSALNQRRETVAAQGQLAVRVYRSGEVLAQVPVAVAARVQGPNLSVTLESRLVGLPAGRLVEVQTAILARGQRTTRARPR